MKLDKINSWLQVIAGFGVITGLLLVGIELRQSHNNFQVELAISDFDGILDVRIALIGDDAASTWDRACNNEPLSSRDRIVLDFLFEIFLVEVMKSEALESVGGRDFSSWRLLAGANIGRILSVPQGEAWFRARDGTMNPQIFEFGIELLNSRTPGCTDLTYFGEI